MNNNIDPNISKFRNTLVSILNIMNRYNGGHNIDGKEFPLIETFDVDEVYDVIDLIYNKFITDKDFDKDEFVKFYKSEFLGPYNN